MVLQGSPGTLDSDGDATVTVLSDPMLSAFIGQTYYFAAVSFDGVTQAGRLSSIARTLEIVP